MAAPKFIKSDLISLLTQANALSFGTFTLKSGRQSPYFFTSTVLHTVSLASAISEACASVLTHPPFAEATDQQGEVEPGFDIIFGPAYKGIPLAALVLGALKPAGKNFQNVSYSFNRKEVKDHGEGGSIIGAPLKGKRILVIDDVLTAGTALREAVSIIEAQGGIVVGVLLLLNRQERVSDTEPRSAIKVASDDLKVPVLAVLNFEDLIAAIENGQVQGAGSEQVGQMKQYRAKYGSQD